MKTTLILATLFCSCTLMTFAEEASANGRQEQVFKAFDKNSDGGVSFDEYKMGMVGHMSPSRVANVFKEKDRDNDGKLNLTELFYAPQTPASTPAKSAKQDDKAAKSK